MKLQNGMGRTRLRRWKNKMDEYENTEGRRPGYSLDQRLDKRQ